MFKTNPFTAPAPALPPAPPHALQHHSQGRHGPKPETHGRFLRLSLFSASNRLVSCQASCELSVMRFLPLHGHASAFLLSRLPAGCPPSTLTIRLKCRLAHSPAPAGPKPRAPPFGPVVLRRDGCLRGNILEMGVLLVTTGMGDSSPLWGEPRPAGRLGCTG